jgi:hypothetical protein
VDIEQKRNNVVLHKTKKSWETFFAISLGHLYSVAIYSSLKKKMVRQR